MWTAFEFDLVPAADADIVIEAALAAFRAYDRWQRAGRATNTSTSGSMRIMESDFGRADEETSP